MFRTYYNIMLDDFRVDPKIVRYKIKQDIFFLVFNIFYTIRSIHNADTFPFDVPTAFGSFIKNGFD